MLALNLDEAELQSRRAFYEITDEDLARLVSLRPFAEKHTDAVVEAFSSFCSRTRRRRSSSPTRRRSVAKHTQREYFLGLFAGRCDLAYVEDRLRVGAAHERIGLSPKWYVGAYRRYMQLMLELLSKELDTESLRGAMRSIQKIVYFDMAIAIDTYMEASNETVRRHQAAVRELSTPVIRVHEGVLLLPLVGTIDSLRAQQVMQNVLEKIVAEQARCVLIDIAGVPVVNTKVADNLVKTTAAVRLLGAQTILTGISAQVARTMVQLGVDISTMHTVSRLADGIELALTFVGKRICANGQA